MRVLVVDDHPVFRDGLAGLLATAGGIKVVGMASTAEEALNKIHETAPDVVLMDIKLPDMSGVDATRRALHEDPALAVVVLTMFNDDDTLYAALAAGARAYLLKDASSEEILAALRTVASGGAAFGAAVAGRMMRGFKPTPGPGREELTQRERQVLDLLARGHSNAQIAHELGLSLKTVQNHVSRVLDKLQAEDRTQAALRARGLVP